MGALNLPEIIRHFKPAPPKPFDGFFVVRIVREPDIVPRAQTKMIKARKNIYLNLNRTIGMFNAPKNVGAVNAPLRQLAAAPPGQYILST